MSDETNTTANEPIEEPTQEPTTESEIKENFENISVKTKKETPKKESKSKTQLVQDEVAKLFSQGWEVKEKSDKVKLNKKIRDNLKLPKGWSSDINNFIQKYMEENKLKISDGLFKDSKIGNMTVVLTSPEQEPTQEPTVKPNTSNSPMGNMPQSTSPKGALPKGTGSTGAETRQDESTEPEQKHMSQSAQEKLISTGLTKMVYPLYVSLGICELDEEEIKEEKKLPKGKQMKQDFENLAKELNEYLIENNIKLPALLSHVSILISIFIVLVLPVIKFKFFSSKQTADPDYDEDADKVKVD